MCGEVDILEMLMDAGANASTPDIHGAYPIHYAAQVINCQLWIVWSNAGWSSQCPYLLLIWYEKDIGL